MQLNESIEWEREEQEEDFIMGDDDNADERDGFNSIRNDKYQ